MGGCFGKKFKKNRVSPDPSFDQKMEDADDIDVRLAITTPFQPPSRQDQLDMIKDLKPDQAPLIARGGVSFDVDYRPATPGVRAPSRFLMHAVEHNSNSEKTQYTREEKEVMAGLLRDDILEERRQRASCDVRLENAARRRAAMRADDKMEVNE